MKNLIVLLTALVMAAPAIAQSSRTDGFCTMDVLAMEKAEHVDPTEGDAAAKAFYTAALTAAKELYSHDESIFNEAGTAIVRKAEILIGADAYDGEVRMIGTKISLWANGDEDVITYYHYNDGETPDPKLKMYLHDEQSATAYWTCER